MAHRENTEYQGLLGGVRQADLHPALFDNEKIPARRTQVKITLVVAVGDRLKPPDQRHKLRASQAVEQDAVLKNVVMFNL